MTAVPVATLILGLVISHEIFPISAGCGNMFLPDQHHALIGHSFLALTGTGRIQCMMLCWRHSRCLSFNHDDTSGMCQLNHARKEEFHESYKHEDNFSYFGSSKKVQEVLFATTTAAERTTSRIASPTTVATTTTTTAPTTITTAPPTAVSTTTTAAPTTTTAEATTTAAATTTTVAPTTTAAATTTTVAPTTTTVEPTTTTAAPTTTTVEPTTDYACNSPFGMESGAIADSQITSGSVLNGDYATYGPQLARFNGGSSWCGTGLNTYIQADLGRIDDIYAIIVQGRQGGTQYVAHFYLSYSNDGVTWTDIVDTEGSDKYHYSSYANLRDERISVESAPSVGMIRCRYIRIRPSGWIGDKCMRFELIGC